MPRSRVTITLSVGSTSFAMLPALMLGSMAVLIREDFALSEVQLGLAASTFFLLSALGSVPSGWFSERHGPVTVMQGSAAVTALAMLALAISQDWLHVLLLSGLCGIGNAGAQVASNHLIAVRISGRKHGLAYGIKMAAVPLAGLLAGVALPLLGLTIGWRLGFTTFAVAGLALAMVMGRQRLFGSYHELESAGHGIKVRLLVLMLLASLFAGLSANSVGLFLVSYLSDRGMEAGFAGTVLALGGLTALSTRVLVGWGADRIGGALLVAATLLGIGCLGLIAVTFSALGSMLVVAALVAFSGTLGWAGLVWLAIAELRLRRPAQVMSVVHIGPFIGGVIGPTAFGWLTDAAGFTAAWWSLAAASFVGAVLFATAHVILESTHVNTEDSALAET